MSTNYVGRHIRGAESGAWDSMPLGGLLTLTRSIACSIGPSQLGQLSAGSPSAVYCKFCTERSRCTTPRKRSRSESEQQEQTDGQHKTGKQEVAAHWAAAARSSWSPLLPVLHQQLLHRQRQRPIRKERAREEAKANDRQDRVGVHLRVQCGHWPTSLQEEMRFQGCCFEAKLVCAFDSKKATANWNGARAHMFVLAVAVPVATISASVCRTGSQHPAEHQTPSLLIPFLQRPLPSCTPIP